MRIRTSLARFYKLFLQQFIGFYRLTNQICVPLKVILTYELPYLYGRKESRPCIANVERAGSGGS